MIKGPRGALFNDYSIETECFRRMGCTAYGGDDVRYCTDCKKAGVRRDYKGALPELDRDSFE